MGRDEMGSIEMFHYRHYTLHKSQNIEKQHSKKKPNGKTKTPSARQSLLNWKDS